MLKNKQGSSEYLPVQWRLVWFRSLCPEGIIETEIIHLDLDKETEEEVYVWNSEKKRSEKVTKTGRGLAIVRATVRDGKGGVATGTKMEKAASFPDFLEKSETGAIGRALAALGYGTQFAGLDFNEEHRIVDSPVERPAAPLSENGYTGNGGTSLSAVRPNGTATPAEDNPDTVATEQQLSSIRKMYERLGKAEPEQIATISYLGAKKLIQQLTAEYRETRQKAS
ncbi:MAG TPA: hypothetical protein VFA10_16640 [Ktedonobacteraceae bacterium]|nr:hypothetical protein [Ktedonobacteraceae bacterium]